MFDDSNPMDDNHLRTREEVQSSSSSERLDQPVTVAQRTRAENQFPIDLGVFVGERIQIFGTEFVLLED